MPSELTYEVPGMSCGSCRAAIIEEVAEVPGVERIEVDLESKRVVVRGDELDEQAVRAAIAEAGYEAL